MKISQPVLILSSVALGLTLVYCEQPATSTPTKAQLLLRQKMAELDNANSLPSKDQLLADVDRLHQEGKISDEQFETFKKNVAQQYAPAAGANSEAQAKAQTLLDQKIAELNAGPTVAPAPVNTPTQAKAEQVLQNKLSESQKPAPAHPETGAVAEQVLRQKIAETRTEEKPKIAPETPSATLTPDLDAKARELLRLKIAEDRKTNLARPQETPEAQSRAVAILNQREAELKAGVLPETPEQTRILRAKIAESKGVLTPAEAAKVAAPPAAAQIAAKTAAGTLATPAIGSALGAFQTSNTTGLARLNELTQLYKADKITPYEYHRERAKIVPTL